MGLIARRVTIGFTPIVSFWIRPLCLTLQDVRRRSKRRQYWRWRAHDVPDNVVRLLLARVHGPNYGLVNGSVARCSMRGIHWIEPVTDRLPTSGHEKAHPTCQLLSNSRCVCESPEWPWGLDRSIIPDARDSNPRWATGARFCCRKLHYLASIAPCKRALEDCTMWSEYCNVPCVESYKGCYIWLQKIENQQLTIT
jgi:hypothetical protein